MADNITTTAGVVATKEIAGAHHQKTNATSSLGQDLTLGGAYTETTDTLTNTHVTVAANASRRALIICNNSDTIMTARIGGTATAAIGIPIPANTHLAMFGDQCPSALVTLFCAGTSKAYTIYER